MNLGIAIQREMNVSPCPLTDVFKGLEKVEAVRTIFGDKTNEVLSKTLVVLQLRKGYLRVDDTNGSIIVSTPYLRSGEERYLYLDIIHELVHIRQYMEGKELFDRRYSYVDRETEIEAYSVAVQEAKRIGMTRNEIVDYLRVDWVTDEEFSRMLARLGVKQR